MLSPERSKKRETKDQAWSRKEQGQNPRSRNKSDVSEGRKATGLVIWEDCYQEQSREESKECSKTLEFQDHDMKPLGDFKPKNGIIMDLSDD